MRPEEIPDTDLTYWLAGILEGEGCFSINKSRKGKYRYSYPVIAIRMTDRDIIERVSALFGGTAIHMTKPKGLGYKPTYSTAVYGDRAIAIMRLIHPIMGERRKARIDTVIAETAACDPTHFATLEAATIDE